VVVADSFIYSPEFAKTYGTAETVANWRFVELLYLNTLGRDYVKALDNNQTNRAIS
jgi:hypothetical protein